MATLGNVKNSSLLRLLFGLHQIDVAPKFRRQNVKNAEGRVYLGRGKDHACKAM